MSLYTSFMEFEHDELGVLLEGTAEVRVYHVPGDRLTPAECGVEILTVGLANGETIHRDVLAAVISMKCVEAHEAGYAEALHPPAAIAAE